MPGSLPVLADFLPNMLLIKVDLPTLGMPQINTRKGFSMPPRLGTNNFEACINFTALPRSEASKAMAWVWLWPL